MRPTLALLLILSTAAPIAAGAAPAPAPSAAKKTSAKMDSCATCYGGHDCRACHTCEYCAHCNSGAKDKCDVYYLASGQKPPWEKKAAPSAKSVRKRHHRHKKA